MHKGFRWNVVPTPTSRLRNENELVCRFWKSGGLAQRIRFAALPGVGSPSLASSGNACHFGGSRRLDPDD
jgi:hypothetical protein